MSVNWEVPANRELRTANCVFRILDALCLVGLAAAFGVWGAAIVRALISGAFSSFGKAAIR